MDEIKTRREENFTIVGEPWAEYLTDTGVRVRARVTVMHIFRVVDAQGNGLFTETGDPIVEVNTALQVVGRRSPSEMVPNSQDSSSTVN